MYVSVPLACFHHTACVHTRTYVSHMHSHEWAWPYAIVCACMYVSTTHHVHESCVLLAYVYSKQHACHMCMLIKLTVSYTVDALKLKSIPAPLTTTCSPDEPVLADTDTEEGMVIGKAVEKGNTSDICKAVRWEGVLASKVERASAITTEWNGESTTTCEWEGHQQQWVRVRERSTSSH